MPTELQIEKLVYGGDGLARLPEDERGRRLTAFVPFTLPGERVLAEVPRAKSGFTRAELLQVLEASPERVEPKCPYFGRCGGCQLQHARYDAQLAVKNDILRETFARAGISRLPEITTLSAEPWGYRNRVRLHVQASPAWRAGYMERRSHRMLAVDVCPIASPLIERAIHVLQSQTVAPAAPHDIAELELFADATDTALLITAYRASASASGDMEMQLWHAALTAALPELRGITLIAGDRAVCHVGESALQYRVGEGEMQVSAGAFFQVNRYLLDQLARAVAAAVPADAGEVWDLFAGGGLFAVPLAARGIRVTAVEGAPASAADLKRNLAKRGSQAMASDVAAFLARRAGGRPDAIVVDPPRSGLGADMAAAIAGIAPRTLVYLSCDPVTLARDLHGLLGSGYALSSLTLIDLFPQTFHMETLAVLAR